MFAVGLVDDLRTIRVRYKVLGQIVAATIACFSGVLFDVVTNPFTGDIINIGLIAYPITIFYLVAFANIINLIDGLDGLAAGIVAISAVALFIISMGKNYSDVALITLAIAGSCIAFLKYNSHPAKIFMGDAGALTLGLILGLVSLFGATRTPVIITLLVPIVIAGIPVIDTFTAIIRRIRSGRSVVEADTSHIHHRLMNIGYDQKTTAYILYVLTGLLSVFALLIIGRGDWVRVVALVVLVIVVAVLVISLKLTDPILKHHFVKRPKRRFWNGKNSEQPTTKKSADAKGEPATAVQNKSEVDS
jgi:UDP-GlcNAc:undecaprenyl-phosphate GlcNAc-1-phosphate transferase